MAHEILTADFLRELLDYDSLTGIFRWRTKRGARGAEGSVAGHTAASGYVIIGLYRRRYTAHRLAWLYVNGAWPEQQIDHINGKADDNRIANLRDVSHAKNQQNKRWPSKNNRSGFLGVQVDRRRFAALIQHDKTRTYIGNFKTPEEAHAAYLEAKRKLHSAPSLFGAG